MHLKRLFVGAKFSDHVSFPLRINLYDYCATRVEVDNDDDGQSSSLLASVSPLENKSQMNPLEDSISTPSPTPPPPIGPVLAVDYSLSAVVVHQGGASGGHYVSYVRAAADQWYYASDSLVRKCTLADVLSSQAYMLFYSKEQEVLPIVLSSVPPLLPLAPEAQAQTDDLLEGSEGGEAKTTSKKEEKEEESVD